MALRTLFIVAFSMIVGAAGSQVVNSFAASTHDVTGTAPTTVTAVLVRDGHSYLTATGKQRASNQYDLRLTLNRFPGTGAYDLVIRLKDPEGKRSSLRYGVRLTQR